MFTDDILITVQKSHYKSGVKNGNNLYKMTVARNYPTTEFETNILENDALV